MAAEKEMGLKKVNPTEGNVLGGGGVSRNEHVLKSKDKLFTKLEAAP